MEKFNFYELTKDIKFEMHKSYNGILLTEREENILNSFGFDIKKYKNIKELMFDIEEYLLDNENEELDYILLKLAEYNYYNNTIK